MKRILIVNDEMMTGGVARVLVNMLKELDFNDAVIDLLILHPHGEMLKDIPSKYNVIDSTPFFDVCDISLSNALKQGLKILFKKIRFFLMMKTGKINKKIKEERKKIIKEEYDVEIAYKEGFCTIFVANGNAKKKINWVHVDYKKNNYSSNHMKLVKEALANIDINVAQSQDAANSYKEVFGLNSEFKIISNFIDKKTIEEKSKCTVTLSDSFNIVSVGRLHYQKAFLRMLDVCSRLKKNNYKFHYYIVGDGEQREQLEKKINALSLNDYVTLVGHDDNPYKYMKVTDLFLLSSIYESAPTVVYEALEVKAPILSTEVAGVKEQLNNGEYGMICDNSADGLYNSLKDILDNPSILNKYKDAVIKYNNRNNEESKEKIKELFLS